MKDKTVKVDLTPEEKRFFQKVTAIGWTNFRRLICRNKKAFFPFCGAREIAKRKRQIEKGMIQVTG